MGLWNFLRGTTSNTLGIGDGSDGTKTIEANVPGANKPVVRFNHTLDKWEFSHDGASFFVPAPIAGPVFTGSAEIIASATHGGLRLGGVTTPGLSLYTSSTDANARNYGFYTNSLAYGDFSIGRSTTYSGSPFGADVPFYIAPDGKIRIASLTASLPLFSDADKGLITKSAADARTALGLVIGTNVLAPNGSAASLTSFPTLNQNTTGTALNANSALTAGSATTAVNFNNGNCYSSGGLVYISATLGVGTTAGIPNPGVVIEQNVDNTGLIRVGGNASLGNGVSLVLFSKGGSNIADISYNSAIGGVTYGTGSDRRKKENILPTTIGLSTLLQIPVYNFNFIDQPNTTQQGFIAQDLYSLYPYAVKVNDDNGVSPLGVNAIPWGIDYGRLTPLIVKSIQELDERLSKLEAA